MPARAGQVVGVAFALFAIALAALTLLGLPMETRNGSNELATHFVMGELPFDFRIAESRKLLGSEVYVAFERDDPREVSAAAVEAEDLVVGDEDATQDAAPGDERTGKLREEHALEDGTPPSLFYLVRYPADDSKSVLSRQFERHTDGEMSRGKGNGRGEGTKLTVDGGRLRWGAYDADFVLERKYEDGGHFTDTVRVNLTHGTECWILFALWPQDYRASREPVEQLLAALPPA